MTSVLLDKPRSGPEVGQEQPGTGDSATRLVDVVVIGAGQAGLSAGYHLQRRGYRAAPGPTSPDPAPQGRDFIILDAEEGPGGAWRHRWDSLRMDTVNGIHDLPGMSQPEPAGHERSNTVLPRYFAAFEDTFELPILRPVRVQKVQYAQDTRLRLRTDTGVWLARAVINATGTWRKPFWPMYPGQQSFRGKQIHTADYTRAEDFAGKHVVVVGGGISALQLLDEISQVTTTTWVTRRKPVFRDTSFGPEEGRAAVAKVEERVRAGLRPQSVVSVTGLVWTPQLRAAAERGVLQRHPMFASIEPEGVRWADGTFQRADVILWATGFRADLAHLAPLRLRAPGGGIVMDGTRVAEEPRVHLIGYGPSSSTVGANRAGRAAVKEIDEFLGSPH